MFLPLSIANRYTIIYSLSIASLVFSSIPPSLLLSPSSHSHCLEIRASFKIFKKKLTDPNLLLVLIYNLQY